MNPAAIAAILCGVTLVATALIIGLILGMTALFGAVIGGIITLGIIMLVMFGAIWWALS